jgi:hypothetical protein
MYLVVSDIDTADKGKFHSMPFNPSFKESVHAALQKRSKTHFTLCYRFIAPITIIYQSVT